MVFENAKWPQTEQSAKGASQFSQTVSFGNECYHRQTMANVNHSMKNFLYLTVIVVLGLIAFKVVSFGQNSSAGPQAWEYKTLFRARYFDTQVEIRRGGGTLPSTFWASSKGFTEWYDDDKQMAAPASLKTAIDQLGVQGWELLTVAPRSGLESPKTDEELWVFKRRKQ